MAFPLESGIVNCCSLDPSGAIDQIVLAPHVASPVCRTNAILPLEVTGRIANTFDVADVVLIPSVAVTRTTTSSELRSAVAVKLSSALDVAGPSGSHVSPPS